MNLKMLIFALVYWGRNFLFVFLENWQNQKSPLEINWPLRISQNCCQACLLEYLNFPPIFTHPNTSFQVLCRGLYPPIWTFFLFLLLFRTLRLFVSKGQLISKCLFGVFNSPKNERKHFDLRYHSSNFCSFFGRIEDTKNTFRNYLTFSTVKHVLRRL